MPVLILMAATPWAITGWPESDKAAGSMSAVGHSSCPSSRAPSESISESISANFLDLLKAIRSSCSSKLENESEKRWQHTQRQRKRRCAARKFSSLLYPDCWTAQLEAARALYCTTGAKGSPFPVGHAAVPDFSVVGFVATLGLVNSQWTNSRLLKECHFSNYVGRNTSTYIYHSDP